MSWKTNAKAWRNAYLTLRNRVHEGDDGDVLAAETIFRRLAEYDAKTGCSCGGGCLVPVRRLLLSEGEILEYLDNAITRWRATRELARERTRGGDIVGMFLHDQAVDYVDAFQSVRMSLFGETLKIEPPKSSEQRSTLA